MQRATHSISWERSQHDWTNSFEQRLRAFMFHLIQVGGRCVQTIPAVHTPLSYQVTIYRDHTAEHAFRGWEKKGLGHEVCIGTTLDLPVWSLDLSVSGTMATTQKNTPAIPPAKSMDKGWRCSRLWKGGGIAYVCTHTHPPHIHPPHTHIYTHIHVRFPLWYHSSQQILIDTKVRTSGRNI